MGIVDYRLLADWTLPGGDPLAAVPAFPAADDFAAPGRSCIHNPEMPAAALAALESTVMVGQLLVVARHACLLRCNSAKLIRSRLAGWTAPPAPASTAP